LGQFGPVWANLGQSGPSGPSGPVWTNLGQSGPVWASMGQFGQSGPVWASLGQSGPVFFILDLSKPVKSLSFCYFDLDIRAFFDGARILFRGI
jgi:hypothetical protein